MAQKGRKPKPTPLKKLSGNPGKRPLNQNEPQPPRAESIKPPHGRLSKHARRLWLDLAPALEDIGLLTQADLAALELLVNHYGFAIEAAADLRKRGLVIEEPQHDREGNVRGYTIKKNPAAQIFRENSVAFRMLATEFGLTPSSRARLEVEPPQQKESLFEEFQRHAKKSQGI